MAALASLAISVVVIVVDASSADHSVLPLLIAPAVAIGAVALARALKTTPSLRLVEMVLLATMIWFVTARGYMTISGADSPADARGAWTTAVLTSILTWRQKLSSETTTPDQFLDAFTFVMPVAAALTLVGGLVILRPSGSTKIGFAEPE